MQNFPRYVRKKRGLWPATLLSKSKRFHLFSHRNCSKAKGTRISGRKALGEALRPKVKQIAIFLPAPKSQIKKSEGAVACLCIVLRSSTFALHVQAPEIANRAA